jgi:murein DD-endopeptidase MepM/ murein hydrolase activator NlpD
MNFIKYFFILAILAFFIALPFNKVYAQNLDWIWETVVGDPRSGSGGGTPGVFKPPFACGKSYYGSTYSTHSDYSVDFNAAGNDQGDPVRASAEGTVYYILPSNGQVHIRHAGGYTTVYAHMQRIRVKQGDFVNLGEQIGEIGNVGQSTGPHLHYNQLRNDQRIKVAFDGEPYPASLPEGNSRIGPLVRGLCP